MSDFLYKTSQYLPDVNTFQRNNSDYYAIVASWNLLAQYRMLYVVQPTSTQQVAEVIKIAREEGSNKINIRSGGHSFEGISLGGENIDGLVVGLIKMKAVTIKDDFVYVEPGVLLGELINATWSKRRKMVPAGTCVGVGVGGQVTCGGYGMFNRKYGVMLNYVHEIEIVTADGAIITANEHQNKEIFWAVLGSGTGSFGVVTNCKLKLFDAPDYTAKFNYDYDIEKVDFKTIFEKLQSFAINAPADITTMMVIWQDYLKIFGTVCAESKEELNTHIEKISAELHDADKKEMLVMNYLDVMVNIVLTQTSAPWYNDLNKITREDDEHLRFMKIKSGLIAEKLPAVFISNLEKIVKWQNRTGTRIQLLALNPDNNVQHNKSIGEDRRACALAMKMSVWVASEDKSLHAVAETVKQSVDRLKWLNKTHETFYPYRLGGYIGDDDIDEKSYGRDPYRGYYRENIDKLIAIKQQLAPENIFNSPMSIPLKA